MEHAAELAVIRKWLFDWPDAPWLMTGTTATAWFAPSPELLAAVLGTRLRDVAHPDRLARIRFYDVGFAGATAEGYLGHDAGRFREAVVAFPSSVGDVQGEISTFMWTDSDAYQEWGREGFGWPLRRASFVLSGPLWTQAHDHGESSAGDGFEAQGVATAEFEGGSISLSVDDFEGWRGSGASPEPSPGIPLWITPRRVTPSDRSEPSVIEITAVEPRVLKPGIRRNVRAAGSVEMEAGHPLHGLLPDIVTAEVHTGFELEVGRSVRVLERW